MEKEELKNAIKALLFAYGEPCSLESLLSALEGDAAEEDIRAAADELAAETTRAVLMVQAIAGGWQMRTNPRYAVFVRRLLKRQHEKRLSSAAIEVLAVIAYKQPVSRDDIESLRGVDCLGVLHTLLEAGLVKLVGKKQPTGAHLYGTNNKKFLEFMGINSIADLPRPDDPESAVINIVPQEAQRPVGPKA